MVRLEAVVEEVLVESLSSLNGVLLILFSQRCPHRVCSFACNEGELLLLKAGVIDVMRCRVVILYPLCNLGLISYFSNVVCDLK